MAQENVERKKLVSDLFHQTGNIDSIVEKTGLNKDIVRYTLRQCGLCLPPARSGSVMNACERNPELTLRLFHEGKSLTQMAAAVGTNVTQVKMFLGRRGIQKKFVTMKYGEDHYAWKGRLIDKDGYVLIHVKNHPCNRKHTNYIFEHRLVMEKHIGRYLLQNEVVHHIDGNKQNNSIENLQLFSNNADHLKHELTGRCPNWSEDGKARIREGAHRRKQRRLASTPMTLEAYARRCIEKSLLKAETQTVQPSLLDTEHQPTPDHSASSPTV